MVRDGRQAMLEIEINPGKANRARVNRADLPRARELVGLVRTVIFAPDDLALVKGDPAGRRRLPRRPAGDARTRDWPACAPTTSGSSSSATRC